MRDDYFGLRDPITWQPVGNPDEFTSWDYALMDAIQTIEDFSDQYGILKWEHDDDNVEIFANRKIHKFDHARESITSKYDGDKKKPALGEYFVPDVFSRLKDEDGNEVYQTRKEWLEKTIESELNNN